ncbi:MAG: hypothetical protein ACYDHY_09910 [Acidiferrobacterales bacterium]
MYSMKQITQQLSAAGFNVASIEEPAYHDDVDGAIEIIGRGAHIQVGPDYLIVVEEREDGKLAFHPSRQTIREIIMDLRSLPVKAA